MAEPKMLSKGLMTAVTGRPDFYDKFPEMSVLRAQQSVFTNSGCSGCRKRVKVNNMFGTFVSIFMSMSRKRQTAFKNYAQADKLYYTGFNPKTQKAELTVL